MTKRHTDRQEFYLARINSLIAADREDAIHDLLQEWESESTVVVLAERRRAA